MKHRAMLHFYFSILVLQVIMGFSTIKAGGHVKLLLC